MAMMCKTCQVGMNSVGQYQQHLNGKLHAKKQKQALELNQGQDQGKTVKSQDQGQGRGKGQPVRGAGGRGRGTPFGRAGRGQGQGGAFNFVQSGAPQTMGPPGVQFMGQVPAFPGMEMQQGPAQFGGQGYDGANQQASAGGYQLFTNQVPNTHFFGGNNSNQHFSNNQAGFTYQHHNNQRYFKSHKPRQPPLPPKPKKDSLSKRDPIVMGDHMGVVSVSIEVKNVLYCDVCSVNLGSEEQAHLHYKGVKHNKKARVVRMREVGALVDEEGGGDSEFYCGFCNVTVNSTDQMKVHKEGSRHKKMEEQRKKRRAEQTGDSEPAEKKSSPCFTNNVASAPYSHMFASASNMETSETPAMY